MDRIPKRCRSIEEAVGTISEAAAHRFDSTRPVIGITGAVGSGKSTLAARLAGTVISTDDYLPDYRMVPFARRDEPDEADLARLLTNLKELKDSGRSVLPVWSFHEHRRVGQREVSADGPIICEGLFALHPHIAPVIDVRVLVQAPKPDRWERWKQIEMDNERGWGHDHAREHFERVADPTFERHLPAYSAQLDFLVENHTHKHR